MAAASNGRLRLVGYRGDPPTEITIELACRSAISNAYPQRQVNRIRARIELSARYPFEPPNVFLDPPIFHPNVYTSGHVCLGLKWIPTEGLDLLVRRIARIVTFDPSVVNTSSPANSDAAYWYRHAKVSTPLAFPTDTLTFLTPEQSKPAVQWRNLAVAVGSGRKP